MHEVLAVETILKLTGGLLLLFLPRTTSKVFGLPQGEIALWPRLLGAVLIGLSGGAYMEASQFNGLSAGTSAFINLVAAVTIVFLLGLDRAANTVRGRMILGMVAILLVVLAVVEISYIP